MSIHIYIKKVTFFNPLINNTNTNKNENQNGSKRLYWVAGHNFLFLLVLICLLHIDYKMEWSMTSFCFPRKTKLSLRLQWENRG